MSQEYDEYLYKHTGNVKKAFQWLYAMDLVPGFKLFSETSESIDVHDESKYSPYEYDAYDAYFYGKQGMDEDDISVIDSAFDYAWLQHIHNNQHHWQHWVLIRDSGEIVPLMMPHAQIYEMICDWWSFSWESGNLYEIFDWYDKHKDKMLLHNKTRAAVEDILKAIKIRLDETKEEKENGESGSETRTDGEV